MPEAYYRSGAAAKELGVSTYHLRRLAESGSIEAEFTGRQWRFPESEIARLKREGVPPIPTSADPERHNPQPAPPNGKGLADNLLAEPSDDVIESAEDVVVTENRLKKRKLERELEETEDFFREREQAEATREAEQQERELERLREQQRAQEAARAAAERLEWADGWSNYALRSMPWDAPSESPP